MTRATRTPGFGRSIGFDYFAIAIGARLPFAMMVVGVLTMVVDARESLALGGLTSAVVGLATMVTGPLLGMAADRYGQRTVLLLAGIANALGLVAIVLVAYSPAADGAVRARQRAQPRRRDGSSPADRSSGCAESRWAASARGNDG